MRNRTISATLGSMMVGLAFMGCGSGEEVVSRIPGVKSGTLEQSWTIEGGRDPAKCTQYKADRMRLVILNPKGDVQATELAPCSNFHNSVKLQTDTYTGNATFIDGAGYPVSRTLPIPQFTVLEDRPVPVVIDFKPGDMIVPH